jgi:hypothetical protein
MKHISRPQRAIVLQKGDKLAIGETTYAGDVVITYLMECQHVDSNAAEAVKLSLDTEGYDHIRIESPCPIHLQSREL